ncbi:MAG: dihydrofolate reductase family protein [Propionicimonas sp.]
MTGLLRRSPATGDGLGPAELVEWLGADPGVRANMVASADGRATVDGRVGALTGPSDRLLLDALRGWCDVLLVGAGTIRAEGYGAIDLPDDVVAIRAGRGPTTLGRLRAHGPVAELFLTLSPVLVGGEGLRIVQVPAYQELVTLTLRDVLGAASELFLRYTVGTGRAPSGAEPT